MKLLVTDNEAGLAGEEAAQWLDRWNIQIKAMEKGAHAQMVERHHDILRKLIHRVSSQLDHEGISVPMEIIVAESSIIKNILLTVGGYCPYVALYGRLPPLHAEFEPASETQIGDS